MRILAVLVALSFSTICFAHEIFMCQKDDRIIAIVADSTKPYEFDHFEPYWKWENGGTKGVVITEKEGLSIQWAIDVVGPDWINVFLIERKDHISVEMYRCQKKFQREGFVEYHEYKNYNDLLKHSDNCALCVRVMIERGGNNPSLLDIEAIRCFSFGSKPSVDAKADQKCLDLIKALDNDKWSVRDDAYMQLLETRLAVRVPGLTRKMELSLEQRLSIERICSHFRLPPVPISLAPLLEKFVGLKVEDSNIEFTVPPKASDVKSMPDTGEEPGGMDPVDPADPT